MNPSDWRIFVIFTAIVVALAAAFYWRFGDPNRSDRITTKWGPAGDWLAPTIIVSSGINQIAKHHWLEASLHGVTLVAWIWIWRRDRRKAVLRS